MAKLEPAERVCRFLAVCPGFRLRVLRKEKPAFSIRNSRFQGWIGQPVGFRMYLITERVPGRFRMQWVSRQLGALYALEKQSISGLLHTICIGKSMILRCLHCQKEKNLYVIAGTEEIPEYPEELESFKKVRVKARHIVVLEAREKEGRKEEKRCGHSNIFAPLPDTNCL